MTDFHGARRGRRWRRTTIQAVCAGYFALLTVLLLSQDPGRYVPVRGGLWAILTLAMPWTHLLSFFVLSILLFGSRWKMPWWALLALMAAYGAATEVVQGFVPHRTPDWMDWLQDVLGAALGAVAFTLGMTLLRRVRGVRCITAQGGEKCEVPATGRP